MKKNLFELSRKLTSQAKKDEMLNKVRENKEKIGAVIRSIKLANKLIRKFGKKIEKFIKKIQEKDLLIETTQNTLSLMKLLKNLPQVIWLNLKSYRK